MALFENLNLLEEYREGFNCLLVAFRRERFRRLRAFRARCYFLLEFAPF